VIADTSIRTILVSTGIAVAATAAIVVGVTLAGDDDDAAPDATTNPETPGIGTSDPLATDTSEAPLPARTPQAAPSTGTYLNDPLEGVECMREPLALRTSDTAVGKLLSRDEIVVITCAQ